jgi:hypothetical protein
MNYWTKLARAALDRDVALKELKPLALPDTWLKTF